MDVLSMWKPSDPSMSFEVEGDRSTASNPSPISIPRTTASLFDSIFDDTNKPKDSSMFPTDNPIKSLNQLDELSNEKKAKYLKEAQLIYDARTEAGLSQKELAEMVNTTQSVISRLEDADYEGHSLSMLSRVAQALNREVKIDLVPMNLSH